ncbi:jg11796 [Pararge aegeria aegeria]|uniref:Jg11796 protein n=1 Tax=Pararge aegeria aegeria TaxID=348720 RepID=A0A8S4SE41_9NEOP|nr:jg11796 [Pararge aegeria aegeria]
MKKGDSQYSLGRGTSRSARLLTDSISSDEPETERLLNLQQPPIIIPAGGGRRQSLTAPPSPTEYRKKRDQRHHNYMNHFHHFIHWRDIWGGEPQRAHEV